MDNNTKDQIVQAGQYFGNLFNLGVKYALLMGFLLLAAYFNSIDYLPLGDFQSSIHVLYIIALSGTLILLFVSIAYFWIPQQWTELFKMKDACVFIVGKEHAKHVSEFYKRESDELLGECKAKILRWYITPICVYQTLLIFSIFFKKLLLANFLTGLGLLCLACTFFLQSSENLAFHRFFKNKIINIKNKTVKTKIIPFLKVLAFSLSTALWLLFLSVFFINLCSQSNFITNAWRAMVPMLIVILSTGFCLFPINKAWGLVKSRLVISIIAPIATILMLGSIGNTAGSFIAKYNIGFIKEGSIIVDDLGCKILSEYKFPIKCEPNEIHRADNIEVLWRVGEYCLRFQDENKNNIQLIIPASYVVSLVIKRKFEEKKEN